MRTQDTLKVSGTQVSPMEIEDVLFTHPEKLISDVSVAGVSGGRTDDEKVPRAWIVLSSTGQKKGPAAVITALEQWHRESLSKYKWLRGGIEVVKEVRAKAVTRFLSNIRLAVARYRRRLRGRPCGAYSRKNMSGAPRRTGRNCDVNKRITTGYCHA
jgi:acyl-CoA synthetase (AMP-forming)/AMP-acid ligase II